MPPCCLITATTGPALIASITFQGNSLDTVTIATWLTKLETVKGWANSWFGAAQSATPPQGREVRGTGVSRGTYRGPARVVRGPEAFVLRFFSGADGDRLLVVNYGRDLRLDVAPEPLLAPPEGRGVVVRGPQPVCQCGLDRVPLAVRPAQQVRHR